MNYSAMIQNRKSVHAFREKEVPSEAIGKYGAQVQALLKKISALEIKTICPLHGPMLTEDLGEYLRLYDLWSQWKPEEPEGILIAHASIHGNTAYASEALKSKLEGKGAQVTMCDLTATCILRRTAAVGAVVQRPLCGLSSGRN